MKVLPLSATGITCLADHFHAAPELRHPRAPRAASAPCGITSAAIARPPTYRRSPSPVRYGPPRRRARRRSGRSDARQACLGRRCGRGNGELAAPPARGRFPARYGAAETRNAVLQGGEATIGSLSRVPDTGGFIERARKESRIGRPLKETYDGKRGEWASGADEADYEVAAVSLLVKPGPYGDGRRDAPGGACLQVGDGWPFPVADNGMYAHVKVVSGPRRDRLERI